jgi:lipopolysaccharide transport system ATP-binding protein
MSDVAIRVERLGKRYRIGEGREATTVRDAIGRLFHRSLQNKNLIPPFDPSMKISSEHQDFIWALRDASFEIKRGEVLGIIGPNGAGKSTLLKMLSRIIDPTEGRAAIRGRVGSLLEVGTGFHPELTGRENVFLNGAILGMKKEEIKAKFDDIVAFSGVEKFIDTPVKHYSSGMHVRLAFAVAAHLEPENLLVDEVLAVGDVGFQKKCLKKIGEVVGEGRTVLFVSHNMAAIRSLCDRAILIDQGRVVLDGEASEVVSSYLASAVSGLSEGEISWKTDAEAPGEHGLKLRAIRLKQEDGTISSVFDVEKAIRIEIVYEVKTSLPGLTIRLGFLTSTGEVAFQSNDKSVRKDTVGPGRHRSTCIIPGNLLNVGEYIVRVGAGSLEMKKGELPDREYLRFQTMGTGSYGAQYRGKWPGVVCPKLDWVIESIE